MRMLVAGLAMLAVVPAGAQEAEPDGPDIVVIAGKPLKLSTKVLRAAQRRFATDRAELSPNGALRFELWRGGKRIPAGVVSLALSDGAGRELPVAVDGEGRMVFATLPEGRWFLTAPAQSQGMELRPIILSTGTTAGDRRLGDLRMECRVIFSMAKAQASMLALPLIGMIDAIGGCESKRFQMFHPSEHPIASADAIGPAGPQALRLWRDGRAYAPPLADRTLGNEVRVRLAYR
ncbi:hypothetical protein [Sphingomonas sp. Leaf62]|uniref:hypothetical protein n=1 Tax=Sphingomonas sp. Leaf62 TaxID=1736228 RepID=UPI000A54A782|nr:hypothetical protein [Sphingomonas sp. Leaf62]